MNHSIPITTSTLISKPLLERIIQATCLFYSIDEAELKSGTAFDIKYKKHLCWYLIKDNVNISYDRIAQRFAIKDSSTVRRMVEKIQAHKNIYAQTLHDIRKVLELANTLE